MSRLRYSTPHSALTRPFLPHSALQPHHDRRRRRRHPLPPRNPSSLGAPTRSLFVLALALALALALTFVCSFRYRVFPIGCIMFVIALLTTKKDFGPMLEAVEATNANAGKSSGDKGGDSDVPSGPLDPKPETPLRAMNALLPFGTIIGAAFFGMVLDGKAALAAKVNG